MCITQEKSLRTGIHNRYTKEGFVKKSNAKHNNKYSYELSEYIRGDIPVAIICQIHGVFYQKPYTHMHYSGCQKCGLDIKDKVSDRRRKTKEQFIIDSNKIHLNKYDYSKSVYLGARKKLEIICPDHGSFWQKPNDHLRGRGCRICSDSSGERIIKKLLIENKIRFTTQKRFSDCRGKKFPLSFDFYLDDYHSLIEFDGQTHYDIVYDQATLDRTQRHDQIKNIYCSKNNIPLLRIPYLKRKDIPDLISNFVGIDIKIDS